MFKNWKIRTKLIFNLGISLVIIVIIVLIGTRYINNLYEEMKFYIYEKGSTHKI